MDYLVTIENTDYFHWQLELLIESFKFHHLDDRLAVGIVKGRKPIRKNFTRNLKRHKRVFEITLNEEFQHHSEINQSYITYAALQGKTVTQPFTLMHCDVVLANPCEEVEDNITFSASPHFDAFVKTQELETKITLPLGAIYKFNQVPEALFQLAAKKTFELAKAWLNKDGCYSRKYTRFVNRMGWMLAFISYANTLKITGKNLESQLSDPTCDLEFIHYSTGFPPFVKSNFKYDSEIELTDENPFQLLSNPFRNISPTTNYIQKIVNQYLT